MVLVVLGGVLPRLGLSALLLEGIREGEGMIGGFLVCWMLVEALRLTFRLMFGFFGSFSSVHLEI